MEKYRIVQMKGYHGSFKVEKLCFSFFKFEYWSTVCGGLGGWTMRECEQFIDNKILLSKLAKPKKDVVVKEYEF